MTHRVVFTPSGKRSEFAEGLSLLEAARALGGDRDNHRERKFTGLGRGDYTLDIMARGADGGWVTLAAPLRIHVQPPPWLRWWAWLLYACVVIALALLLLLAWRRRLA